MFGIAEPFKCWGTFCGIKPTKIGCIDVFLLFDLILSLIEERIRALLFHAKPLAPTKPLLYALQSLHRI
jgi:hypothetical protein